MADIYNWINSTGTITTDAGAVLQSVVDEYKSVFGQDLVVPDSLNIEGASTPQGLLIVTEALARLAVTENNAALANQINPNLAGGIFLDAILELTGLQRTPATSSQVMCTLRGVEGTSIPAGAQASVDGTGSLFQLVTTTVIPMGGEIENILFESVETGAIGCPAGDLNHIVSDILGWEQIENPADATLGRDTQSDVQARAMRLKTLALQGSSVAGAIISAVSIVENVKSMTFLENTASTTEVLPAGNPNGVSMPPHSIYCCVDGGTDLAVAQAMVSRKSGGSAYCNSSGAMPAQGIPISQNVTVPFSGQVQTVLFDRPNHIQILVAITVKIITPLTEPVDSIKQAILDYAAGDISGITGLVVGQAVSAFEIAGAVATVYPGVYVQRVFIAKSPTTPVSSDEIPMEVYEIASITASDISVTIS